MADNIDVTEGSGKTVATDDVAGAQYQRVKIDLGSDGAASPLVRGWQTKANSIPVCIANDQEVEVVGNTANDAAAAGNPVRIGGKYKTPADNDEVNSGDVVDLLLDDTGCVVLGHHPGAFKTNNNWGAAQTNTQIQAAPGAGLALFVTSLTFSSDGTAAGSVSLVEDTGGVPATIAGPYYFPDSAGIMTMTFPDPIKVSINKNLGVTSTGATNLTVTTTGRTKAVAA